MAQMHGSLHDFFQWWAKGSLKDGSPQRGPGAESPWRSGAKPPEADDIFSK